MRRLYLVGGSAGAGKTTTCRGLARKLGAGWLQVDTVWLALQDAFPSGSEQHTLLSVDERIRKLEGSAEELVEHQLRASEFVCAALRRAFIFELEAHPTVVADGAWLLPKFMASLELEDTVVSGAILHEADPATVKAAMDARRTAARKGSPWHDLSATVSWQFGNFIADEARRHGIAVVAGRPRDTLLDRLADALGIAD